MNIFKIRETPAQNIAFIAIMCALGALFSLFGALFPLAAIFIMIFMPLVSILVAVYCKTIYYPIYIVSACLVCFIASCWDFQTTLFYAYPAIIVGFLYGVLLKKGIPSSVNVFFTAILQFLLFLLSLLLIKTIYEVDMREVLITVIGKENDTYASKIFPTFAFAYSLAQIGLSHIFITVQIERLGIEQPREGKAEILYPSFGLLFSVLGMGLCFISSEVGYLLLAFAIYWAVLCVSSLGKKIHWSTWICLSVLIGASILLMAALYGSMEEDKGLMLTCLFPASISISHIFNFVILRKISQGNKIQS